MDNFVDFAAFNSQNALKLHVISLFLQQIITEQMFYYGETDKHNERKNTYCSY